MSSKTKAKGNRAESRNLEHNYNIQKKRKSRLITIATISVTVVLIVVVVHFLPASPPQTVKGNDLPSTMYGFHLISNSPLISPNAPSFLFLGSEACPFCAAESWPIFLAMHTLGGSWKGTSFIYSDPTDVYPHTPGISFYNASLDSAPINFIEFEMSNSTWAPLQKLNQSVQQIYDTYDPHGYIPFLLVDGIYARTGSSYLPSVLSGLSYSTVYSIITNKSTRLLPQVFSEANNITSLVNSLSSRFHASSPSVLSRSSDYGSTAYLMASYSVRAYIILGKV